MKDKLLGLQIGRALAALAVVFYHAKLILNRFPEESYLKLPFFYDHGGIGVPFFFVISGFIICYVIDKDSHSSLGFFIKRVFRLWPTYIVCTVFYVAIYLLHRNLPGAEIGYTVPYVIKSLLIFPQAALPALHPGWSLEHEVLFYLLAMLVAMRFGVRALFYTLLSLVALSFMLRVVLPAMTGFSMPWDYHVFAIANLCFLFGAALYLFWKSRRDSSQQNPLPWIVLGTCLVIIAPYLTEQLPELLESGRANKGQSRGFLEFFIEGGASSVLLYGLLMLNGTGMVSRCLISIGDRSYSLYLCHFMFIPIFQNIHRDYIKWPQQYAEILCVAFVLLSVAASYLLYWCVERPSSLYGRDLANRLAPLKTTVITRAKEF